MHGSEDMLKSHMFGRRKDPPRGLQLMDLAHPLDPRMVDDTLFGRFPGGQARSRDKRDVPVNGVVRQTFINKIVNHRRPLQQQDLKQSRVS